MKQDYSRSDQTHVVREELVMKKLIGIILKTIFFLIVWIILLIPNPQFNNDAYQRLWLEFQPLVAIIIPTILFVLIAERNKIKVPIKQGFFKNSIIGIALGVLWLGSVITFLLLTNTMNIQGQNNINLIWIWILAVLLNAATQELLVRGYLYQLWKQKYNVVAAIVLTTAIFTIMHAGAFEAGIIPVLNVISMSVFITLLLEYTGTLIAPIVAHFVWNAIGAIILGGVSLAPDYPNLFNSTFQGNSLLSGGIYKIEGSIIVLIVNLILIVGLFGLNKRKNRIRIGTERLPQKDAIA